MLTKTALALLMIASMAAQAKVCDTSTLTNGSYNYSEQGKVRAHINLARIGSSDTFDLKVSQADRISGFQVGTYRLELAPNPVSIEIQDCVIQVLNGKGEPIVALSNPELKSEPRFSAQGLVGINGVAGKPALHIYSYGFTGCGGEGSSGECAPAYGVIAK